MRALVASSTSFRSVPSSRIRFSASLSTRAVASSRCFVSSRPFRSKVSTSSSSVLLRAVAVDSCASNLATWASLEATCVSEALAASSFLSRWSSRRLRRSLASSSASSRCFDALSASCRADMTSASATDLALRTSASMRCNAWRSTSLCCSATRQSRAQAAKAVRSAPRPSSASLLHSFIWSSLASRRWSSLRFSSISESHFSRNASASRLASCSDRAASDAWNSALSQRVREASTNLEFASLTDSSSCLNLRASAAPFSSASASAASRLIEMAWTSALLASAAASAAAAWARAASLAALNSSSLFKASSALAASRARAASSSSARFSSRFSRASSCPGRSSSRLS